jgi:hypothetical protein
MAHTSFPSDRKAELKRPKILVTTALNGAQRYRRQRDLPGAIPGLLARPADQIVPKLREAEAECEESRRARSAAYRPARHVQILAALLAECAPGFQAKASGSDALRSAI